MRLICLFALVSLVAIPGSAMAQFGDPRIDDALHQLKTTEPSIREVQKSALEFFNIDANTVGSMRTRAKLKALLPKIEVRYRAGSDNAAIQTYDFLAGQAVSKDDGAADLQEFQVSGSWNLPSLMFNAEVLDVSSLAVLQEGVLKNVTRLYYTRRRMQVNLILNPPRDAETRITKSLRIEELTATLDAMTGNLFARRKKVSDVRQKGRFVPQGFVAP